MTLLKQAGFHPAPKLLEILEGNPRLTIRTIQAFSAEDLFKEILEVERALVRGTATGEWVYASATKDVTTKQGLLEAFAALRSQTLAWWEQITEDRLAAVEDDGFGWLPVRPNLTRVIYSLENEIHHRGQVYVYLRQLGVEPPAFYER